jgi:hypothetical protein
VRAWHVVVVVVLAASALWGFVALGRGAAHETKAVGLVPVTMPQSAARGAAAANVSAALASMEAFHAEHGTYAGATVAALRTLDPGLDPTVMLGWVQSQRYCIESTVAGQTASATGPGGKVEPAAC